MDSVTLVRGGAFFPLIFFFNRKTYMKCYTSTVQIVSPKNVIKLNCFTYLTPFVYVNDDRQRNYFTENFIVATVVMQSPAVHYK